MLTNEQVFKALSEIEDPEFPTSIVDLGLICRVDIEGSKVRVHVTFTAMGCPAMDWIQDDIRSRLLQEPGITTVETVVTWDPVWSKKRITQKGRDDLLIVGVVV